MTTTTVTLVLHIPRFSEASVPSTMRINRDVAACPRQGEHVAVPGNRVLPVDQVRHEVDGTITVHFMRPADILQMTGPGLDGIRELEADLHAAGWRAPLTSVE